MRQPNRADLILVLAAALALGGGAAAMAEGASAIAGGVGAPEIGRAVRADRSAPLRVLARRALSAMPGAGPDRQGPVHRSPLGRARRARDAGEAPAAAGVQTAERPLPGLGLTPPPIAVWQGTTAADDADLLGFRIVPPTPRGTPGSTSTASGPTW